MPVADFDARLHAMLAELGIDVEIREQPFGVPMTTPFPAGRRARVLGSRGDRALRPHPRLVGHRLRGVQRLVQRQDEPRAPLLAQPRPRCHSLLGPGRHRRSTPIRSTRRPTRTSSSRSASGPATTPSATPPTTPTPRPSPRDSATNRFPRAAGSSTAPAHWRCFPTRSCAAREIQERPCSRSARAPTRPALASPAGTPAASNRSGVQPPAQLQPAPRHRRRRLRPSQREHLASRAQPMCGGAWR